MEGYIIYLYNNEKEIGSERPAVALKKRSSEKHGCELCPAAVPAHPQEPYDGLGKAKITKENLHFSLPHHFCEHRLFVQDIEIHSSIDSEYNDSAQQ